MNELEEKELRQRMRYNSIGVITSSIQTVAVILGIYVAVNEFVWKDRIAQNEKISRTLSLYDELATDSLQHALSAVQDGMMELLDEKNDDPSTQSPRYEVRKKFYEQTLPLAMYFDKIKASKDGGLIDSTLIVDLLRPTASAIVHSLEVVEAVLNLTGNGAAYSNVRQFASIRELFPPNEKSVNHTAKDTGDPQTAHPPPHR